MQQRVRNPTAQLAVITHVLWLGVSQSPATRRVGSHGAKPNCRAAGCHNACTVAGRVAWCPATRKVGTHGATVWDKWTLQKLASRTASTGRQFVLPRGVRAKKWLLVQRPMQLRDLGAVWVQLLPTTCHPLWVLRNQCRSCLGLPYIRPTTSIVPQWV
jgi:hypothetical protein